MDGTGEGLLERGSRERQQYVSLFLKRSPGDRISCFIEVLRPPPSRSLRMGSLSLDEGVSPDPQVLLLPGPADVQPFWVLNVSYASHLVLDWGAGRSAHPTVLFFLKDIKKDQKMPFFLIYRCFCHEWDIYFFHI